MNHLEYMRKIGRKGGAKRASHPLRIEMARKAAYARWSNQKSYEALAKEDAKRIRINHATPLASYPNELPSEK